MEKRSKLLILIILAATLLAFGLWYLLKPIMQWSGPPPLPSGVVPNSNLTGTRPSPVTDTTPALPPDLKQLKDQAGNFVSRSGSGSSSEGFQGYEDVMLWATPSYQAVLRDERAGLQKLHPVSGPAYGIVTRVISIDASQAVLGADAINFIVQAQQAEDAGDPGKPTSVKYKEAIVLFSKQADGKYLVAGVTWKDIER